MCGRFYFTTSKDELKSYLPEINLPETLPLRYNISPTQPVPVVIATGTYTAQFELFRWGLIPSWAKDATIGSKLINARAETLSEKPSFRTALRLRRCVVLASGFYEWMSQRSNTRKIPFAFRLSSGAPMLFAGLWEMWQPADGQSIHSCTIITTQANELMKSFHERMPVLLARDDLHRWLNPALKEPTALNDLLHPCPAEWMQAIPASPLVNNPGYDAPDCLLK